MHTDISVSRAAPPGTSTGQKGPEKRSSEGVAVEQDAFQEEESDLQKLVVYFPDRGKQLQIIRPELSYLFNSIGE